MAEYRRQAQQQQQRPSADDESSPKCHRCGGTGWLQYRIVEIDGFSTAILQACECDAGRKFVQRERERDERFKQYAGARPQAERVA
jgi:hypothetical protein